MRSPPLDGCTDAADLLLHRMSALGLAPTAMARTEPEILRDLKRRCVRCDCRELCRMDLFRSEADRSWVEYCANSVLLNALTEVWSLRALH